MTREECQIEQENKLDAVIDEIKRNNWVKSREALSRFISAERRQAVEDLPHVVRDNCGTLWVQQPDSPGYGLPRKPLKVIEYDYGTLVTICGKHREPDPQPQPTAAAPSPLAEVCRAAAKYLCTGNPFDRAALVEVLERIGGSLTRKFGRTHP